MMKLIEQGDRVYVIEELETKRSVNPHVFRKANELIVFGFNKRFTRSIKRRF